MRLTQPEWRNWFTRGPQKAVSARACGFESHLRHHITHSDRGCNQLTPAGIPSVETNPLPRKGTSTKGRGGCSPLHRLGIRAGVRSIEHESLVDDEAIALMADQGTYLVATSTTATTYKRSVPLSGIPKR